MSLTRRTFLQASLAAPFCASPVWSQTQMALGAATLTTVSDGHLVLPADFIFGPMPQDALPKILKAFDLSPEQLAPDCNLALYRDGTHTVLFDVGSGPDFMPTAGRLLDGLAAIDLAPEDITHVVFTHAHPDHIWGLLDDFDDLLFPDAVHMIGRAEWDYWWDPRTVDTIGEARQSFAVGARRRLEAIEDAVTFIDDGAEILPGIAAIATHGHTPGHMAFEIRQGGQAALVLGDALGNHHVAFQHPDWHSGSDQDAETAAATRAVVLDRLVTDDLALVGFHLPGGGIGRAEKAPQGYRFVAEAL